MTNQKKSTGMLLAMVLASGILALPGKAQSPSTGSTTESQPAAPATGAPYRFHPDPFAGSAGRYYSMVWGVDSLSVKAVESGEIIRFSYRVVDPEKAKMLNDKKLEPALVSPEKGIKLVVPSLEQVGSLRQSSKPEAGKAYWMAFSNSGRLIRKGDRVTIAIGEFRAGGLNVE
jgi:hypothetical protein